MSGILGAKPEQPSSTFNPENNFSAPPPPEPSATEVEPARPRRKKSQLSSLRIPTVSGGDSNTPVGY